MSTREKRALSIGGGKGGIGKSCLVANLGAELSSSGRRVILVDTDIEAPNLHTFVGIPYPKLTLDDYFTTAHTRLEDIVLPTPVHNLHLISSAGSRYALSGIPYQQRQRFVKAVMNLDADVIIFDVAAGTRMRVIDYYSIAPVMVIVIEPLPTAIENAYAFLKNLFYRHLLRIFYTDKPMHKFILQTLGEKGGGAAQSLESLLAVLNNHSPEKTERFKAFLHSFSQLYIVINKVRSKESLEVVDRFARVVKRYLMLNLHVGGHLPFEMDMDTSIMHRTPYVVLHPQSGYTQSIRDIIMNLF